MWLNSSGRALTTIRLKIPDSSILRHGHSFSLGDGRDVVSQLSPASGHSLNLLRRS